MNQPVRQLLSNFSISISPAWHRLRLESHPDYPSLLSVQDTLEELGIESYVCKGSKEELTGENKPFLAHLHTYGGQIVFCKSVADAEKKIKNFDKQWSGHVMFINPTAQYGNTEHDKLYNAEKQNRLFAGLAVLLLAAVFITVLALAGAWPLLWLTLSCMGGLYFSRLIAQKEMGIHNSVSDKICSLAKHSRCEAVLLSRGSKLFNWLSWGDVGMVYFSSSLLFILLWQVAGKPAAAYYWLSLVGLVFPLYSLYYQWKVVKQWCMLCIGVLAVLFINAAISSLQLFVYANHNLPSVITNEGKAAGIFLLILLLMLSLWQIGRAVYLKSLQSLQNEIKALRMKRNPQLFTSLVQTEEHRAANLPEADEAIRFGNPAAPYRLVIACNPYCGPCATAHHAIEGLYEKNPGLLQIAIRFALNNTDDNDKRTAAARDIIKAARTKPFEAIRDWYQLFDIGRFRQKYPMNGADVNKDIDKHIAWSKQAAITATPTFFINGRKLPELFNWTEMTAFLEYEMRQ